MKNEFIVSDTIHEVIPQYGALLDGAMEILDSLHLKNPGFKVEGVWVVSEEDHYIRISSRSISWHAQRGGVSIKNLMKSFTDNGCECEFCRKPLTTHLPERVLLAIKTEEVGVKSVEDAWMQHGLNSFLDILMSNMKGNIESLLHDPYFHFTHTKQ